MNAKTIPTAKFKLGKIVVTARVGDVLTSEDILKGIARHQAGDWGEAKDPELNKRALVDGTRVLSVYRNANGIIFWIITEADRSVTTVMLPEDH